MNQSFSPPIDRARRRRNVARIGATVVTLVAAFVSCSPTFQPKACTSDGDCGSSLVCVQQTGPGVCKSPADAPIRIGMSAPVSGPSQDLGTEMKKGVGLAFDAQNAAGGIHGRQLQLNFRDDQYVPAAAEQAAHDLLDVQAQPGVPAKCPTTTTSLVAGTDPVATSALVRGPNGVIALLGNVGTPTMVRTAPIAVETQSLFFGAFTGSAKMLRDGASGPCGKYIFNVRASYGQEARATLEFFVKLGLPDSAHLLSFDQNDTFGQAGYDGLVNAWTSFKGAAPPNTSGDPANPIKRFRYTRDDQTSVPAQITAATAYLASILASDTAAAVNVGILMTDTYGPGTTFIKGIRDWQYAATNSDAANRLKLTISNVSFVGPNSLAGRLKDLGTVQTPTGPKAYSDGVFVSQVVPNYESDSSDAVAAYKKALLDAGGLAPSFTSLEGYLAARVFIAGLLAHQGPFTADALIDTFEHLPNQALGLGANAGFTPCGADVCKTQHSYSKSVWGTALSPDGSFTNRYFWTDGTPLQLFE
jgi:branched-chain amino acid transport system substrate-binding protein